MSTGPIVIIGAGQAAAVAAHALREHGWPGTITMLGRERHRPYERPPLSKAALRSGDDSALDVLPDEVWHRTGIVFKPETEVVGLNTTLRQVRLSNGGALEYEKCLIATGGEAITLPSLPRSHGRIHYLRTIDDARRLRDALASRPTVVVLGGGFLGLEVAYSCLAAGASVRVIEREASLLERFLPTEVSQFLANQLRLAGGSLDLGTTLSNVDTTAPDGIEITTGNGTRLDADEVVVAVGLSPNDGLAKAAGLDVAANGGVLVDSNCRTSDQHVFACGDCTSQRRLADAQPTRVESWQNANAQARVAAAAMLGLQPPAALVPWFWTDQGSNNIQVLGIRCPGLNYFRRGNPSDGRAIWLGLRDRVPVHAVGLNAALELRAIRPLLEQTRAVDADDFTRESTNLRTWVKQQLADAAIATL